MRTQLSRLIAAAIATAALLAAWGTASAAPYVLVAIHSRSAPNGNHAAQFFKSGTAQGCPAAAPFRQPCYNPANSWITSQQPTLIADVQANPATWDWNGTTMTQTGGILWQTAFNGSNAIGTAVLSFRTTSLAMTPTTSTSTAATYTCYEGTFLATVNTHGCSNVEMGTNGLWESPVTYNVGGAANCLNRAFNGNPQDPPNPADDVSLGGPRGVATAAAGGGCDAVVGMYDLWFLVPNPRFVILSRQPTVAGPDGCYMFGRASQLATSPCVSEPTLADASYFIFAPQVDTDGDGVIDALDNCRLLSNATQVDSNGDGYGNRCDGDLNNNGSTNAQDTVLYRQQLGQPSVAPTFNAADINANGSVNAQDTTLYRQLLAAPPGPSGPCLNTFPCPAHP